MAILNQAANLNLIPGISAQVVVHLSQANVGDTLTFYLYSGSEPFSGTGVAVALNGVRKDGVGFTAPCIIVGNVVTVTVTEGMTALPGYALAELVLTDGSGASVGTANFALAIEEGTFPNGPTYDTDISVYQQILQYVQSYPAMDQARIDMAVNSAFLSERTARIAEDNAIRGDIATLVSKDEGLTTSIRDEAETRQKADEDIMSALNAESAARAEEDANLQTQIDEIVAPSGEAPSTAEIQNARIGANGRTYASLGEAIRTQINDSTQNLTYTYTDASHPFDLNAFKDNAMVYLTGNGILNAPAGENNIVVMCSIGSTATNIYEQIVFSLGTGNIYIRRCVNNTWYEWMTCGDTRNTIITQSYYHTDASHPKDLNTLDPNTFWYIGGTNIQNSPVLGGTLFVFTLNNSVTGGNTIYSQIVYSFDYGTIYVRSKVNANWNSWKSNLTEKEFHVGSGQEYTSVTQAVQDAANYKNRTGVMPTVVIHEGEYDLIAEGAQDLNDGYGLMPTVNIKGIGNVRLYAALSTPSDVFSIFTPSYADITIENLTLEITNCRYCIHDEAGVNEGVANRAYHHRYKNLKCINHGWTSGTDKWKRCIGIGLSGNGRIDIEDCAFETEYSDTSAIDAHSSWSYHQDNGAVVKVHGCYIPTGGVSATSMGDTTDYMNEMYVYGNRLPNNPSINDTKNMSLYAWGNTIG